MAVHRVTAIALSLLFICLPVVLSARERRGADLVITLKDGQTVTGELIAVKQDSLLLLNSASKDEAVDIAGVRKIKVVKKSRALKGALYGFLAGAAVASVLYLTVDEDDRYDTAPYWMWPTSFGTAGSLIGLGAGALAGMDETIQLEGTSESAHKRALAALNRNARLRDFR